MNMSLAYTSHRNESHVLPYRSNSRRGGANVEGLEMYMYVYILQNGLDDMKPNADLITTVSLV